MKGSLDLSEENRNMFLIFLKEVIHFERCQYDDAFTCEVCQNCQNIKLARVFIIKSMTVKVVQKKFNDHFNPKKNGTCDIFNTCYHRHIINGAKSCEFGTLHNSLIRDRIVCGVDCNNTKLYNDFTNN